ELRLAECEATDRPANAGGYLDGLINALLNSNHATLFTDFSNSAHSRISASSRFELFRSRSICREVFRWHCGVAKSRHGCVHSPCIRSCNKYSYHDVFAQHRAITTQRKRLAEAEIPRFPTARRSRKSRFGRRPARPTNLDN